MHTKTLVLLLALLVVCSGPWMAPTSAQTAPNAVDVSVAGVRYSVDPIVNESITVFARINTTGPAYVQVRFEWGDTQPLSPGNGLPLDSTSAVEFTEQGPGSKEVSLGFSPPFERRGPQDVRVIATVTTGQDTDSRNNTLVNKTVVRFPKLNLTFANETLDVVPQGEAVLRYFVRNDGNVPDNATTGIEVYPGNPWTVEALGPLPVVPPGGSVTGVLVIRPNATTTPANLSLNVTARSGIAASGDERVQAPPMRANESLYGRRPTIAIDPLPANVQVFADEERALLFTVRNTGDLDHVVRVSPSIVDRPAGWNASMRVPASWQANLSAPDPAAANHSFPVALRPNESVVLQVNVTRLSTAPNLTATLRLEANTTNGDRLAALAGGSYRAVATTVLSDAGPDLTANVTSAVGTIYQGDAAAFRVQVSNPGRANATNATLRLELRDNLRTVEETTLPVPPIASGASATLTWTPSTSGLRGAYVLLGRVDANATQQDRNPENNTFRLDLHVRAPTLVLRAPETLRVVPGGRLTLTSATGGFSVENQGDREESIVVDLDSSAQWLRAQWRVSVPAGAIQPLPLQLDVPQFPGAQSIPATLAAHVEARPRFEATARLAVEMDDVETPRLAVLSPAAPTVVGQETRIAVRASDASGIRRAEVILQSPTGERTALPLQRDAADPDVYATRHTPAFVGAYLLEFRVEDASLQGRVALLENVTWTVQASAYAGMKPANFGEDARVGAQPLRLAEARPGTTKSVLVDFGTGFQALVSPWEFTLPPVEGARTIAVRATGNDGTPWEGRWNVTVDLTPPSLTDASTKDAGAGKVDLAVRAEGAKDVVARFQTGTGPVEVSLASRGGGIFGASVTAPSSWDSVTFVAKDEAGNEGSTVLDAPDNDTPGVGTLLALAALGLIALGRRRKA